MLPIHELLNRIRWDADFGQGHFLIGYYDRVTKAIVRVEYRELDFPADARHLFQLTDAEGQVHRIPFHRVREVVKDGTVIWRRPASSAGFQEK